MIFVGDDHDHRDDDDDDDEFNEIKILRNNAQIKQKRVKFSPEGDRR